MSKLSTKEVAARLSPLGYTCSYNVQVYIQTVSGALGKQHF